VFVVQIHKGAKKETKMKEELDNKLVDKYPKIFADRHASVKESAMGRGFECNDGWYDLIYDLCGCIQRHIDSNPHLNISQMVATQVKEKFGTLRFYYTGGDIEISGMVRFAEYLSGHICEECGEKGEVINDNGWYMCRCHNHLPEDLK
jgi:hypothetical protein